MESDSFAFHPATICDHAEGPGLLPEQPAMTDVLLSLHAGRQVKLPYFSVIRQKSIYCALHMTVCWWGLKSSKLCHVRTCMIKTKG